MTKWKRGRENRKKIGYRATRVKINLNRSKKKIRSSATRVKINLNGSSAPVHRTQAAPERIKENSHGGNMLREGELLNLYPNQEILKITYSISNLEQICPRHGSQKMPNCQSNRQLTTQHCLSDNDNEFQNYNYN